VTAAPLPATAARRPRCYGPVRAATGSTDMQSWMSAGARAAALATCWTPAGAAALPDSHSHAPKGGANASELWNAMVAPLVPYTFGTLLWDQGEANAHYCAREQYLCLFGAMVADWRAAFRAPALPVGTGAGNISTVRFAPVRAASGPTACTAGRAPGRRATTWACRCPRTRRARTTTGSTRATRAGRRLGLQVHPLLDGGGGGSSGGGGGGGWETSGPVVQSVALRVDAATHLPSVAVTLTHAAGLALLPAQGCFEFCCDGQHNASAGLDNLVFQVANRRGVWLPAEGAVAPDGATLVMTPFSPVTCTSADVDGCWLAAVRYGCAVDSPSARCCTTRRSCPRCPRAARAVAALVLCFDNRRAGASALQLQNQMTLHSRSLF
jgi:hypothetical protein